jgi:hypothetical protein
MKHTPGPWSVAVSSDGHGHITYRLRGQDTPSEQHYANAALIACAPELLHACEDAFAFLTLTPGDEAAELEEQLRAVITKALGGEG